MSTPSIHDMVRDYLLTHGYDGLAGEECGCAVDDLMPCGDGYSDSECRAGWRTTCPIDPATDEQCCDEPGGECWTTERGIGATIGATRRVPPSMWRRL